MTKSPIKRVVDLIESGFRGRYEERLKFEPRWQSVGDALPEGAVLLRHENHDHLGVGVPTVTDWLSYQYGISDTQLGSPRSIYQKYRELGVTHVHGVDKKSRSWDSLADDMLFFDFAINRTVERKRFGAHRVGAMPPKAPSEDFNDRVLVASCGSKPKPGVYRLLQLGAPSFGPRANKYPEPKTSIGDQAGAERALGDVAFVVEEPGCHIVPSRLRRWFVHAVTRRRIPGRRNPAFRPWVRRKR